MLKKILSLILVALMVLCLSACKSDKTDKSRNNDVSSSAENVGKSNIYYIVVDGTAGILGFKNDECASRTDIEDLEEVLEEYNIQVVEVEGISDIVIPREVNGVKLEFIDGGAFKNCHGIKSIEIPKEVIIIEPGAFDGCSEDLVIRSTSDSEAHEFAEEYGIKFEVIS